MAFCSNCGKPLKDGDIFCGCCGAKRIFTEAPPVSAYAANTFAASEEKDIADETVIEDKPIEATEETVASEIFESAENTEATPQADIPQAEEQQTPPAFTPSPVAVQFEEEPQKKKGSAAWLILGLFFPIVGLILFLVWRKKNPKSAKFVGIGAIIGGIIEIVAYITLFYVIVMATLITSPTSYYPPDGLGQLASMALSFIGH